MVLLVIDTQKGIMDEELFDYAKTKKNIKELIDLARKSGTEVIYVQHDDGPGSGFSKGDEDYEIFDEFAPQGAERIFTKTVNSALHPSTGLAAYLAEKGEKEVMVVGLQTNYCIDSTIRTGFDLGLTMIVPEHANSTFDNDYMTADVCYHYYNDEIWPERFATCVSMKKARAYFK